MTIYYDHVALEMGKWLFKTYMYVRFYLLSITNYHEVLVLTDIKSWVRSSFYHKQCFAKGVPVHGRGYGAVQWQTAGEPSGKRRYECVEHMVTTVCRNFSTLKKLCVKLKSFKCVICLHWKKSIAKMARVLLMLQFICATKTVHYTVFSLQIATWRAQNT